MFIKNIYSLGEKEKKKLIFGGHFEIFFSDIPSSGLQLCQILWFYPEMLGFLIIQANDFFCTY